MPPGPDPAPIRVLVIEDEAPLRALLRDILADEGYAVDTAADGHAGWALLAAGGYDLVLCNVMLPYLDGSALVGRLRADPALRDTPVILLSAAAPPAVAEAAGADAFVAKPFDLDALLATVERVADTAYP